jgi:hypothetical protein
MFIIKCPNCNWQIKVLGDKKSILENDLKEIKNNCATCGKPRKFICKKCSCVAKAYRIS